MHIISEFTDTATLQVLGDRITRYRIEAGLTQADLAERAGIGKRTVERIEAGCGAELVTLIRVLRVLKMLEGLDRLLPELPPSPIAQLKLRGKARQRASHPRRQTSRTLPPRTTAPGSWTWGVEAPRQTYSAKRKT